MAEERRGGDGTPYPPFRFETPPLSQNGHRRSRRRGFRDAVRGVPAGLMVSGFIAASIVPRLSLLNLAFFNPWQRPVVATGVGGLAAGASRRGKLWSAALVGAACGVVALWIVYGGTRLQNRVLFVERDPVRVILADLGRLAAYAIGAGSVGAAAGQLVRRLVERSRSRRTEPITSLPGFEP
jgi:hypothetical protein